MRPGVCFVAALASAVLGALILAGSAAADEDALYVWNLDPAGSPKNPGASLTTENIDVLIDYCGAAGIHRIIFSNWDTRVGRSLSSTKKDQVSYLVSSARKKGIVVEALYCDNVNNKLNDVVKYNSSVPENARFSAIRFNQEPPKGVRGRIAREQRPNSDPVRISDISRARDTAKKGGLPFYMSVSAYWDNKANNGKPYYERVIDIVDGVDIQVVRTGQIDISNAVQPAYAYAYRNGKKAWVHIESIDPAKAGLQSQNTFYSMGESEMRKVTDNLVVYVPGEGYVYPTYAFHSYRESFGGLQDSDSMYGKWYDPYRPDASKIVRPYSQNTGVRKAASADGDSASVTTNNYARRYAWAGDYANMHKYLQQRLDGSYEDTAQRGFKIIEETYPAGQRSQAISQYVQANDREGNITVLGAYYLLKNGDRDGARRLMSAYLSRIGVDQYYLDQMIEKMEEEMRNNLQAGSGTTIRIPISFRIVRTYTKQEGDKIWDIIEYETTYLIISK